MGYEKSTDAAGAVASMPAMPFPAPLACHGIAWRIGGMAAMPA